MNRILIADDDKAICTVLSHAVRKRGWEPITTHHGDTLLDWVREGKGDVVITDVRMPVGIGHQNGLDLLPDIRKARPDLPVIVISGVDELDSVVRCLEMGAADYLPKTVDPAILRARITSSLARKRLHDAERDAVERQAATNEVLAIMSRSVFERDVVLSAIVDIACWKDWPARSDDATAPSASPS